MGAVGRILLILVVIAVVAVGAGFFLLPNTASRTETLTIERPAQTVFARLASTPVGTVIAEGVTTAEAATADGETVTVPVAYADEATGRVVYTVTPQGEGARVRVRLEQDLGPNPMARFSAIGGGPVSPLISGAAANVTADLNALPTASFEGLQYVVEQVEARPFFYIQNCSPTDPESVTSVVQQALTGARAVMGTLRLTPSGDAIAVEPRVADNQYCYNIGYPYTGRRPGLLAIGAAGETPSGQALRMTYTGAEDDVIAQVYDPMDALLAAAHLDNPSTRDDDWTTFEVYHDDPLQEGGSRNRDIYYVVPEGVDITALTSIAPPAQALAAPPAEPAADPAAAPAATTPAEAPATAAETPAETPAPAPTP